MDELQSKYFEYKIKGYCCSQILLQLGVDQKDGENQGVINAVEALCNGFFTGRLCGALTGGACLMSYLVPKRAVSRGLITELFDWFESEFSYLDCNELLKGNPLAKIELCPVMVERTYEKVMELLDDIGYCPL